MSRIQDSLRSIKKTQGSAKKAKSSKAARPGGSVSELKVKLPESIFKIPKNRRAILDPDHLENSRIIHDDFSLDAITPYKMLRTRVLQKMDKNLLTGPPMSIAQQVKAFCTR